jgi:hypothetical protein
MRWRYFCGFRSLHVPLSCGDGALSKGDFREVLRLFCDHTQKALAQFAKVFLGACRAESDHFGCCALFAEPDGYPQFLFQPTSQ